MFNRTVQGRTLLALEVQKYTKIEPWEMYYRFVPLTGGDSNPDLIYLISSNCIKFHATYTVIGTRVNHQKFIRTLKRQRKKRKLAHIPTSSLEFMYWIYSVWSYTRPIPIVKKNEDCGNKLITLQFLFNSLEGMKSKNSNDRVDTNVYDSICNT